MNASDLSDNAAWTKHLYDLAARRLHELGLDDRQIEFMLENWANDNEDLAWLILAPPEIITSWRPEC